MKSHSLSLPLPLFFPLSLPIATINLGRIAALLAYCYRLCRTYIDTYFGSKSLLTFMAMIAGWLFKVFLRARVYEWLEKQGGWVRDGYACSMSLLEGEGEEREREKVFGAHRSS